MRVFRLLTGSGLASGATYWDWKLARSVIREALRQKSRSRRRQTSLCSITSAVSFKFFERGGLIPTLRPNPGCYARGSIESITDLCRCYKIGPPQEDQENLVGFLEDLADKACVVNPGLPRPARFLPPPLVDIELRFGSDGQDAGRLLGGPDR